MRSSLIDTADLRESPICLLPMTETTFESWRQTATEPHRTWAVANDFRAESGDCLLLPGSDGGIDTALIGLGADCLTPAAFAKAARKLPPGVYHLTSEPLSESCVFDFTLAWATDSYRYQTYRTSSSDPASTRRLVLPKIPGLARLLALVDGVQMVQDLINTPAEDMGPADLAAAAGKLADDFAASVSVVIGPALVEAGFPLIAAVGRASPRPPCLIDLRWGDDRHPEITIVGKGICFDTGGLDLKPSSAMRLMKKDMGGAAHALGLARMIMGLNLPVCLRVLIPAADNAIGGNALRPGDIVRSRSGLSVEIANTDAEGRLLLADALTAACEEDPDLLIDLATLTGAARVALGPDLPALFTDDDALAARLFADGLKTHDPLWRLPLWADYAPLNDSKVADMSNCSDGGFAGAITAALFLKRFVRPGTRWAHLDLFAWRPGDKPCRPEGGSAQALRPLLAEIERLAGTARL